MVRSEIERAAEFVFASGVLKWFYFLSLLCIAPPSDLLSIQSGKIV